MFDRFYINENILSLATYCILFYFKMNLCLISNFITLFGLQIKDSLTLCCFTALGYVGGENMYYEVKSVGEGKGIFFKDIFNKHTRQSQRLRIILQVMQTIKQRLHSDKVYDIPNGVIV